MTTCSDHAATPWQSQDENPELLPGSPQEAPRVKLYLGWGLLSGGLPVGSRGLRKFFTENKEQLNTESQAELGAQHFRPQPREASQSHIYLPHWENWALREMRTLARDHTAGDWRSRV